MEKSLKEKEELKKKLDDIEKSAKKSTWEKVKDSLIKVGIGIVVGVLIML